MALWWLCNDFLAIFIRSFYYQPTDDRLITDICLSGKCCMWLLWRRILCRCKKFVKETPCFQKRLFKNLFNIFEWLRKEGFIIIFYWSAVKKYSPTYRWHIKNAVLRSQKIYVVPLFEWNPPLILTPGHASLCDQGIVWAYFILIQVVKLNFFVILQAIFLKGPSCFS